MKRTVEGYPLINWEYCFICQRTDKVGLRKSDTGLEQLAARLKTIWEFGGQFDFDINQGEILDFWDLMDPENL